jgi:hypothetical protein
MQRESNLVYEIWEIVRDHVSGPKKIDAATSMIRSFSDFGFDRDDFLDACEEDDMIKSAVALIFHEEEDDDEEE